MLDRETTEVAAELPARAESASLSCSMCFLAATRSGIMAGLTRRLTGGVLLLLELKAD